MRKQPVYNKQIFEYSRIFIKHNAEWIEVIFEVEL